MASPSTHVTFGDSVDAIKTAAEEGRLAGHDLKGFTRRTGRFGYRFVARCRRCGGEVVVSCGIAGGWMVTSLDSMCPGADG